MTIERLEPRRLMDAGDLDSAFGDEGSMTRMAGAGLRIDGPDIDVGPSNEIVMTAVLRTALFTSEPRAWISVWRATAGGLTDSLFGRNEAGQVLIPLPDDVTKTSSADLFLPLPAFGVVMPDGGILAHSGYRLYKLRTDGKLDRSFAHNGHAVFTDFEPLTNLSVDVDSRGRIYVTGYECDTPVPRLKVLRLNADGSLDKTFAAGGIFARPDDFPGATFSIKVLRDGDVMIAGSADAPDNDHEYVAIRLNDDGSLDQAYGVGGIARNTLVSYDLDITTVFLRAITDDGYAIFHQDHNLDSIDYAELTAFDPAGVEIPGFIGDTDAINNGGEFLRDDALFVSNAGRGVHFYDQQRELIAAATANAEASLDLNQDNQFIEAVTLARDGSILVTTALPGEATDESLNNGFRIHRMFRDDAPILQYTPRALFSPGQSYVFSVRWADEDGIDLTTLGDDDITVALPGGGRKRARLIGSFGGVHHRYSVTGPDGIWDASDNGVYTVRVERRGVRDLNGNAAAQRVIGSFLVQI